MRLLPGPQLILVVIDGLADRRVPRFSHRTPLEAARTKTMDRMAKQGTLGMHYPLRPGLPVGSGVAHNLLFGLGMEDYPGRGPLEALGLGFRLEEGDLAFRVNFATINNRGVVIDRRAGRNERFLDELAGEINSALEKNPFKAEIELRHGYGHRGALVVKGWGSADVDDMDPQVEDLPLKLPPEKTRDGKLARWIFETARRVMEESVYNIKRERMGLKKANALVLRGAGIYRDVPSFEERWGLKAVGIAREHLYLGAAKFAGMDTVQVEEDGRKVERLVNMAHRYDFFFLHFKQADNYGHDGMPLHKRDAISEVDRLMKPLLELDNVAVAVTGDHATPCELKTHSGDPVPVLFWGANVPRDGTKKFSESEALKGAAGLMRAEDVLRMLFNYAGRMPELGK